MKDKIHRYAMTLGPGALFASAAIGASHLVQSTRAGAEFGLVMIIFVVLANMFKYPFFEFSTRYTSGTGISIINGYGLLGRRYLALYFGATVASMFFVTAAVGVVTSGLLENLLRVEFLGEWSLPILFVVCVAILIIGRYSVLDSLIKMIGAVLLISTVLALAAALWNGPIEAAPGFEVPGLFTQVGIFFLIALMGWMPMPLDLSSWQGLWAIERIKQTSFRPRMYEALVDFGVGYVAAGVIAVFFIILGAYMFHGIGEGLPDDSASFAGKLVELYTSTIGEWSGVVMSASVFSVMFGTVIAVLDGYTRVLAHTARLLIGKRSRSAGLTRPMYTLVVAMLAGGALLVAIQFSDSLSELVDFATSVSFVIAPLVAVLNFRLVTGRYLQKKMQPPAWLKTLAYAGIVFLTGSAVIFLLLKAGLPLWGVN
ncbi:Mn2 and Fe2 transporter of the NRAMP family [Cenarchaeum symbiosum A]|uniref:Mn2 and Fe2 transporter of the NRAMP family n=1 Tax=Cenarchaeum symbiosum (strain A) TaxID=414004 RepID=A0RYJ9_CENSY|nr:Mn2 and Fe2 transporter of the NRAMP family [Cenarchaeum symbiosum A]